MKNIEKKDKPPGLILIIFPSFGSLKAQPCVTAYFSFFIFNFSFASL